MSITEQIKQKQILIVDDITSMRTMLTFIFKKENFKTPLSVESVDHALETLKGETIDLIITDWCMPGRDGLDLIKTIRKNDKTLPIIMVTGARDTSQDIKEAVMAGANDYLLKPVIPAVLVEKVSRLLEKTEVPHSIEGKANPDAANKSA